MSVEEVDLIRRCEERIKEMTQVLVHTEHLFHAGVYARTIHLVPTQVLTGTLIKRTTLLVIDGDVDVFDGNKWNHCRGFHLIAASANRKQMFYAVDHTTITMLFATEATTVEEAEREFTNEHDLLLSRVEPNTNTVVIGER